MYVLYIQCLPKADMVADIQNPPTLNEKSHNVQPNTSQPQPYYDNNSSLLVDIESPILKQHRLV